MPPFGQDVLVQRPRLVERLSAGLRGPVTLVVAPAGSGKTSLMRSWRRTRGDRPTAWVSLDEDDNDPIRFWRYVVAGLETVLGERVSPAREHLDGSGRPHPDAVVTTLINILAGQHDDVVLVLDDMHAIEDPAVHESLTFLIERQPPCLRLLIVSRVDPPLPLARWRARGQLAEIRAADLRFTEPEASELLASIVDERLTAEQVAALTERTEGWAAGLLLAALALRGNDDTAAFLDRFTGSHHFVMTYLLEDVLAHLQEDVQQFLQDTSILGQLSGELCDALTGRDDGERMLRQLTEANMFIQPLDDSGRWYRYHQLFAGMLRHRLQQTAPERVSELHQRASAWFDAQSLTNQAIDHALLGGDYRGAANRIARVEARHLRGGTATIRRWIEQLPGDIVASEPKLCMSMAWSCLISGPLTAVDGWLRRASDAAPPGTPGNVVHGEAAAIRAAVASFAGDMRTTIDEAEIAMRLLAEDNSHLRGFVAMGLGQAYRFEARLDASNGSYREAVRLSERTGNLYVMLDSLSDLGMVLMQQGKLREAEKIFRQARQVVADNRVEHLPVAGSVAVIWPELQRERHQLDNALDTVRHGIELGELADKRDLLITGYRTLGKILWSTGDWDGAREALRESFDHARDYGLDHTARTIDALQTNLAIAHGDIASALDWMARAPDSAGMPGRVRESETLTRARVLLATGEAGTALTLANALLDEAEREGWVWTALSARVVLACAREARGDQDGALYDLGEALRRAAPEGFVRVFLDEGTRVLALLRKAETRDIEAAYARVLLDAAGTPATEAQKPTSARMIDPLSEREETVLRLLNAGLSSPEIARELYVSPSTVRTHVKSIYRKLDVHSRDQAVARAREMALV